MIGGEIMIEIEVWLETFIRKLESTFGKRIEFVGLQGSYGRGEATETSDIDVVVIFDELQLEDISNYHDMLEELPNRQLVCGFIAGKEELENWDASDLFQFYFDTKPIKGTLDQLVDLFDEQVVERAIKMGACNIYHACVHNMLHEKSEQMVRALYKSAAFTVQAIHYQQTEEYVGSQKALLEVVDGENREVVRISLELKSGADVEFDKMSHLLFEWSKRYINRA